MKKGGYILNELGIKRNKKIKVIFCAYRDWAINVVDSYEKSDVVEIVEVIQSKTEFDNCFESENFISYLNYLCGFDYKNMEDANPIIIIAKKLLENDNPKYFYDDFLTYGWYTDEKQTNVINVNALAELIYFIKNDLHVENKDLVYVHDEQKQFKGTIKDELL